MEPDLNVGGGQFAQGLGGSDALRQALRSRGMSEDILSQVSGSAPTSNERMGAAPIPSNAPQAIPQQAPRQTQGGIGLPPNSGEAAILIKALDSRLKTLSKLDEAKIPATAGVQGQTL